MKLNLLCAFVIVVSCFGCGSGEKKANKDFFTSGSREADQRADQRMAKEGQLRGEGGGAEKKPADEKRSLYERLGEDEGIKTIVNDFVPRAIADPRVNFERKGVTRGGVSLSRGKSVEWSASKQNVDLLRLHLTQFFCLATGGPTTYQGREMKQVHESMHITNAEFDAAVGDLKATLDKLNIANQEQKELLSIVESTRPQVVEER